jgi:ADP-heptose:LPS heptosyltransferase
LLGKVDVPAKDKTIAGLEGTLKVKNDLDDYLSCEIKIDQGRKKAWIHLLKKLRDKFWDIVKDMPKYVTPGTLHQVITRKTEWKITPEEQSIYRSGGVGMLLFPIKHSRPDIANTVRELTKVLDGVSPAAHKELKRVIKYVLDTEKLALKIQPEVQTGKWSMVVYSNSDYATDPDNRMSISGFVLYLCGIPIVWRTKQQ